MKNQNFTLIIAFLFIGLSGCTPVRKLGTVTFQPNPPEIFTKNSLRTFLRQNDDPKIVLRVPTQNMTTIEEENFSLSAVYNSIEKELLKGGFNVRDRGLFNVILEKSQNKDYSSIKELTDTDIILEVVGLNVDVEYNTNKYKDRKGREKKVLGNIELNGAKVEFKTILVQTNELAGTYQFNYAPCVNGCKYYIDNYGKLYTASSGTIEIQPYELVETNALEDFMASCTRDLIDELRN